MAWTTKPEHGIYCLKKHHKPGISKLSIWILKLSYGSGNMFQRNAFSSSEYVAWNRKAINYASFEMTSKTRKSTYRSLLKQAFLLAHYWCKYPANRIYIKGSLPDKLLLEILQKDVLNGMILSKIIFLLFHSMARCTCPQFLFWLHL